MRTRPISVRETDDLIEWLVERSKAGYQIVNSVQRLQEMKAFLRMAAGGTDLTERRWYGDGSVTNGAGEEQLEHMPGVVQGFLGDVRFADWNCRAGQNNFVVRTDGTLAPCFPTYSSPFDWENIDGPKFDPEQLAEMKKTCQQHCFSTLNHSLAYCYDDARVIKFIWTQIVKNRLKGGARSFED